MGSGPSPEAFAEYIAHDEFRAGIAQGRFRVVVNPKLARRFVSQRLMLIVFLLPIIGVGLALALMGRTWLGAALVAAGVLLHRAIAHQAPKILLDLATRDAKVYVYVTREGIMEVRRA
ncbi:hypothetical protein [Ramlibacter sp.]|uniref:hypothetical protein n=1 Tax=Ramlibacter sp. TaxID=1917967 RepID=UPI003D0CAAC3